MKWKLNAVKVVHLLLIPAYTHTLFTCKTDMWHRIVMWRDIYIYVCVWMSKTIRCEFEQCSKYVYTGCIRNCTENFTKSEYKKKLKEETLFFFQTINFFRKEFRTFGHKWNFYWNRREESTTQNRDLSICIKNWALVSFSFHA